MANETAARHCGKCTYETKPENEATVPVFVLMSYAGDSLILKSMPELLLAVESELDNDAAESQITGEAGNVWRVQVLRMMPWDIAHLEEWQGW